MVTLEDMPEANIENPQLDKVRCVYDGCNIQGQIYRCYLHVYVYCPKFQEYYSKLTPSEKRILLEAFDE